MIVERCPARAALAGNPSDGYGGAVLAVPVPAYHSEVTLRPADRFVIGDADSTVEFEAWDDLRAAADRATVEDRYALVLAAIRQQTTPSGALEPFEIEVTTTIPRSVGLAGSSAIMIATLRALRRHAKLPALAPDVLASSALRVERDILHISAGLQDRVVQAYNRPVMMRFGPDDHRDIGGFEAGTYETVTAGGPLHLLVAYRPGSAEPSQVVHRTLRNRFDDGEAAVVTAMVSLTRAAEGAATAFADGSVDDLGAAIDRSFELRRSILDLLPEHVEMIEVARRCGASANYAGSGGSVVALCSDAERRTRVRAALTAIGCHVTEI